MSIAWKLEWNLLQECESTIDSPARLRLALVFAQVIALFSV